ncbi:hypothetical protein BH11PSE2_BH11PSE2_09290 [soil metagenome]
MERTSKSILARELLGSASLRTLLIAGAVSLAAIGPAFAQTPAGPASSAAPDDSTEVGEIVATGYRASLAGAIDVKRKADVMVDAINAEDIADFPDANLAESLQRLPGVTIDRDNGEGRGITVRGLGADFTRVRLNGMEALSTAGSNDSGTNPNRGRGFDFNTFASELFSSLKVQKTQSAETDEGSLGATVDLITGRPFNFKGRRVAFSVENAYYENGKTNNPRYAGLLSDRWFDGKLGALVSFAYSERNQFTDSYGRQPAQFDYTYRQSTFPGTPAVFPVLTVGQSSASALNRMGFALPTGTACNAIVPGQNVTNATACAAYIGSNPVAYALVNNPTGQTLTTTCTVAVTALTTCPTANQQTTITAAGPLIKIPGLATLNQQQLQQERLGLTGSIQFRPTEKTLFNLDGVFSHFYNNSENFQVQTIGLNRHNTSSVYNTATSALALASKRALYNTCSARAATAIADALDCGQQMNGGAVVAGTQFSFNPFNLEPYDYYNAPTSVGFIPDPLGLALRDRMEGRETTKIIDAALSPNGANADYLKLGNIDLRSADDQQYYTTNFQQLSLGIEHDFSNDFRMTGLIGKSTSKNSSTGILSDFIRLDSGQGVAGNDYLIYDERGDPDMPLLNLGFDAANPANWEFLKNYSVLRHFERLVSNSYQGARFDFEYHFDDHATFKFGFSKRKYGFDTITYQRQSALETLNPSLLEAGSSVAAVSKVITFGQGLNVPAGTTTSFIAPSNQKLIDLLGFTCNCINKYGDWRIGYLSSAANLFGVDEIDTGYYGQADFDVTVFGRPLRGNAGARFARTQVEANGLTNTARAVSNSNNYDDVLPSANLVYEVTDKLYFRFGAAKVMARPLLGNLAPSITAFTVPTTAGAVDGGSLTIGNTKLQPFRAVNYDFSAEWYFAPGGLVSVAIFDKDVSNFPQTVVGAASLSSFLDADTITQLVASQTNANALAYLAADRTFNVRQFRDAPGGYIRGVEISYQQNLTFLPGLFSKFGLQANYTHIDSELQYIVDPGAPATTTTAARPQKTQPGPFLGASPDSVNFTLYYDADRWQARVSTAYRAEYFTAYPVATGTCDPGFCDAPLINDFVGSKATTNVDASFSYKVSKNVAVSLEALNITNQKSERFAYANDPVVTTYASTGRQYFAGLKVNF